MSEKDKAGLLAALECARNELTTLHGLTAFDASSPNDTLRIDVADSIKKIDDAINYEKQRAALAWVRVRMDGKYGYLLLDSSKEMTDVRRKSGVWVPLVPSDILYDQIARGEI